MKQFLIFVVEDDPIYARILQYHLSLNPDYEVEVCSSGRECISKLYKNPSVISLDYSLPDMSGLNVIKAVKKFNPEIPVIIISGQEDIATAVTLLKEGASDYIIKNDETKTRLWNLLINIRENVKLREEISSLREEIGRKYDFHKVIVGNSPQIVNLFNLMEKAVQTGITVSITGETGTGKELIAKAIHYNSLRSKLPFVAINVSAIPRELIESEMFGYEKGAFTGANARKIGKFEEADRGTLFLDEIGDMDMNLQSKLLRVLQEKEIVRVGGNTVVKVDVRLIVATHKNLAEMVGKGLFREDLFYRLLGLPIDVPPLRNRGNDIVLLAKHFLDEFCKSNNVPAKFFNPEAAEKILNYNYPGNVRELKAIVDLACVLASGEFIRPEDVRFNASGTNQFFYMQELTLHEYTRRIIRHFLDKYEDNVLKVAKKLDVGKSTIYRMMKNNEL
ncbi:MAG: sigma-54 dependent transcriptional regulator [Bacteroidota bacterium]